MVESKQDWRYVECRQYGQVTQTVKGHRYSPYFSFDGYQYVLQFFRHSLILGA